MDQSNQGARDQHVRQQGDFDHPQQRRARAAAHHRYQQYEPKSLKAFRQDPDTICRTIAELRTQARECLLRKTRRLKETIVAFNLSPVI